MLSRLTYSVTLIVMTTCSFSTVRAEKQQLYLVNQKNAKADLALLRSLSTASNVQLKTLHQAEFNKSYDGTVHTNQVDMYEYKYNSSKDPITAIRINTAALNSSVQKLPMVVVIREERSVISWQIPLLLQYKEQKDKEDKSFDQSEVKFRNSERDQYRHVSRTLCPVDGKDGPQQFFVEISSQAKQNVSYTLTAEFLTDFQIRTGRDNQRNVTSTPSRPVYFRYTFKDGVESVLVTAKSTDKKTATLSIQNTKCPVFDLDKDVRYTGQYQTMTTQGAIVIDKTIRNEDSFYIVLVVKPIDKDDMSEKNFTIYVEQMIPTSQYYKATLAAAALFIAFYIVAIFIGIFYHGCKKDWGIVDMAMLDRSMSIDPQVSGSGPGDSTDISRPILQGTPGMQRYGAVQNSVAENIQPTPAVTFSGENDNGSVDSLNSDDFDLVKDADHDKDVFRTKTALYVYDLARKNEKRMQKHYKLYSKNLFTIAIFYGLPVIQLVLTYQKVLNLTGDQDICYYNFACAHPLGTVSSFNNIYSNIGYFLLGLLFLILVARRDYLHKKVVEKSGGREKLFGIPQHFGLFYAMGMALCMEGVMSACYHVCPTVSNFQFDTSFMYIMACLCILKIYQNRHPDISAKAHSSYLVMALIIIVAVIGVVYGTNVFWVLFAIVYMTASLILSIHIYYMGRWSLDRYVLKRLWMLLLTDWCKCSRPMYLNRMILLVVGNIVNWGLAIYGVVGKQSDFASFLLSIFIGNLLLYIMFYIFSKILAKEKIPVLTIVFIVMSMVTWGVSLYFFTQHLTSWQLSPAESRAGNKECILFEFYDHHDVWHFLSAISLFFSFLVILTLDDEIIFNRRDKIPVF